MEENIIIVKNLSKSFSSVNVFIQTSFNIPKNSISALTGKNGSGKTTLIKILSGLILPDEGEIFISGINMTKFRRKIKQVIGTVVSPENSFYPQLTVYENLVFLCRMYKRNIENIKPYIEKLNLQNFKNTKFCFCSSGIKHRMAIVASLIHNPKILLIDELTKSIDPETKNIIYEIIKSLNKENGVTSIFVTHNLDEVHRLAQYHFTIKEGKICTNSV